MASDEKQPPRGSGDRIEWFTVSYRTLSRAVGGILLVALVGWFFFLRPTAAPPPTSTAVATAARFQKIDGSVQVKRAGTLEWLPATLAVVLRQNDLVRTGSGAAAEILFTDGTVFTVRPDSLITIEESSQNPVSRLQRVALSIQSGEANFQTAARSVPGSTTISTPTLRTTAQRETAGNIQVAEGGATGLRIFRGQGEAQTRTGQRIALGSNEGVRVDASGAAGPKLALPNVPQLTAPSNGTDIAYPDLRQGITLLLWGAVPDATAYRVMVDFSPSFARPLYDRQITRTTQMELRALDAGSYFWRVSAVSTDGSEGGFSELWRFTLARSPQSAAPPPTLLIEAAELRGNMLQVRGRTEPGATLSMGGVRLEVQADGSFNEFVIFEGGAGATVRITATGTRGGTVEQSRRVAVAD